MNEQCEMLGAIGTLRSATMTRPASTLTLCSASRRLDTRRPFAEGNGRSDLEVVLTATPAKLRRRTRPIRGNAMIDAAPVSGRGLIEGESILKPLYGFSAARSPDRHQLCIVAAGRDRAGGDRAFLHQFGRGYGSAFSWRA